MSRTAESEIEMEAAALRRRFQIGETDTIDVEALLLKQGIVAFYTELDTRFSSLSLQYTEEVNFILVNSTASTAEQHLAVAHELYHIYVQDKSEAEVHASCVTDPGNAVERHANTFASYFLAPRMAMADIVRSIGASRDNLNAAHLVVVCNYFKVPYGIVLRRVGKMLGISNERMETLRKADPLCVATEMGLPATVFETARTKDILIGNYAAKAQSQYESHMITIEERNRILDLIKTPTI